MTRLKKGDPAPDISLPSIDGSTFEPVSYTHLTLPKNREV